MKKFFTVLGVIFFCLVLALVVGFTILNHFGGKLDTASKGYVDEVVPIILSSWNVSELLNRESPELSAVASRDDIIKMFDVCSKKLGQLKEYKGAKGQAHISISEAGKVVTANYIADVIFEKADASVLISTILRDDTWQIMAFKVTSEALMP